MATPKWMHWLSRLIHRGCGSQPQASVEPETMDREPLAQSGQDMPSMHPSPACFSLVRDFEGLSLSAYRCPAGVLTIGYGHTGRSVYPKQRITSERALQILHADMELVAISVSRLLSVPVTQGQFDALCSFAFNVGAWENGLSTSTLLRKLNQGDVQGAGGEFSRWVYATVGGEKKRLQGLVRRREAEAKLFRTGQYP